MPRTIRTKVFEFDELKTGAQERALRDFAIFEANVMDENSPYAYIADEMEYMKTPWFLSEEILRRERFSLIETIRINNYEFFANGELYHTRSMKS